MGTARTDEQDVWVGCLTAARKLALSEGGFVNTHTVDTLDKALQVRMGLTVSEGNHDQCEGPAESCRCLKCSEQTKESSCSPNCQQGR